MLKQQTYFFIILAAINANKPSTNPDIMPTIGPVYNICILG